MRFTIGNEKAVKALASLCRDYEGTASRAMKEGDGTVFIPANTQQSKEILEVLVNLDGEIQFESQGNTGQKEPCYASLEEFLKGRNADGTEHRGYFLVDASEKVVVDLRDRDGKSVVFK